MQIVDAQIHIWGSGLPSNMAHRQVTSFTAEEAIAMMDEGGVNAAVIHPVGWDPNSTQMALDAVHKYPGRFAIMGSLPLDEANTRPLVEQWRQTHGMLGLRYLFLSDAARQQLDGNTLDWFWAACEAAGVPVAVLATDSLARLGQIAERHPGLRLTIDHLGGRGGNTTLKDAAAMTHRRAGLFQRGLPLLVHAHLSAADLRRLRPEPHVLGHRHHQNALLLAAMRGDVHQRATLAPRRGSPPRHGPGHLRLVGLGPIIFRHCEKHSDEATQGHEARSPGLLHLRHAMTFGG
jgi:hypothetical protein